MIIGELFNKQNEKLISREDYVKRLSLVLFWNFAIDNNSPKREKYDKLFSTWNIESSIFLNSPKISYFEEKFLSYINSDLIDNYIITVSYVGTSGIRVPAAILFSDNEVRVITQKVGLGLLSLSLKNQIEEFCFRKKEFEDLDMYNYHGQLCYQLKHKGISVFYEVIVNEKKILVEDYLKYQKTKEIKQTEILTDNGFNFCPNCGKKTIKDMRFCGYCGQDIASLKNNN